MSPLDLTLADAYRMCSSPSSCGTLLRHAQQYDSTHMEWIVLDSTSYEASAFLGHVLCYHNLHIQWAMSCCVDGCSDVTVGVWIAEQ